MKSEHFDDFGDLWADFSKFYIAKRVFFQAIR